MYTKLSFIKTPIWVFYDVITFMLAESCMYIPFNFMLRLKAERR